jgi:AI-2 transport protein TqsA
MPERRTSVTNVLLGTLVVFFGFVALYASRPIIVPMLFGLFLAVLVQPAIARLNRRLPFWLSLGVVLTVLLAVTALSGVLLVVTINDMVAETPRYAERFEALLATVLEYLQQRGLEIKTSEVGLQRDMSAILQFLGSSVTTIFDILGRILVVVFLGLFAVFEARRFEHKVILAFGPQRGAEILDVLRPMAEGVARYLRTKTIISLFTGLVAYLLCLLIGIDFAFMWGVLVFVLNFLPYIGPVAAVLPAIAVAFVEYDTPTRCIITAIALGASQVTSGMVIEPQIMGQSFRISPLFVMVSMLFWGWFWGLPGVVLAIPVSAAMVVGCANIERLKPVAIMLGMASREIDRAVSASTSGRNNAVKAD